MPVDPERLLLAHPALGNGSMTKRPLRRTGCYSSQMIQPRQWQPPMGAAPRYQPVLTALPHCKHTVQQQRHAWEQQCEAVANKLIQNRALEFCALPQCAAAPAHPQLSACEPSWQSAMRRLALPCLPLELLLLVIHHQATLHSKLALQRLRAAAGQAVQMPRVCQQPWAHQHLLRRLLAVSSMAAGWAPAQWQTRQATRWWL